MLNARCFYRTLIAAFTFISVACTCETEPSKYELNDQDKAFLTEQNQFFRTEIKISNTASVYGDEETKAQARIMNSDFGTALEKIQTISENTKFDLDINFHDETTGELKALDTLRERPFDSLYTHIESDRLHQAIILFDEEIEAGVEPSVVAFAKQHIIILQRHASKMEEMASLFGE